jgi:hypothetical protein
MASGVGVVVVVAGEGVRGRIRQRASNSHRRRMEEGGAGANMRGGGFDGYSHRRRMENGGVGANMRLIRVEDCSLNVKSRHNFVVEYIHIYLFININSYLCVVRHVCFTIGVSNSFITT